MASTAIVEVAPRVSPTSATRVDEDGRGFGLDRAGERLLGHDIDAAFAMLLRGSPAARRRDGGNRSR